MANQKISISAHYVCQNIDLVRFQEHTPFPVDAKMRSHVDFRIADDQWMRVYGFGAVVLINLPPSFLKRAFTKKARQCCTVEFGEPASEEYAVVIDPTLERDTVEYDAVRVRVFTPERRGIIADILAQSVVIDNSDAQAEKMVQQFSVYTTLLEQRGRLKVSTRTILKLIGKNYGIIELVVARLSLLDRPETVWEDKELEHFFEEMRLMFDLEDRFKALDFKLQLIQSHSSLFLQTIGERRIEVLEIIIVALIVFEIGLFLYDIIK